MTNFNIQPILENEKVSLLPLEENDFDGMYSIASDPKIWEQHPNKDRWQKEEFTNFFEGAILSKGAFKIIDKRTNEMIGGTRFYDYNEEEDLIFIGYTFFTRTYWGTGINPSVKAMMMNYIFQYVSRVGFHVGAGNIRSQIAVGRIGGEKTAERETAYFKEKSQINYIYEITRSKWESINL
ncbi:GNAT family N-acetyltransferase [Chryseobacterium shigense]|uniref:Protein N-acetyltransferase, RimJ/RimL family n=1 Tax=Chryseobacterium shigense TaxID=297244 RepID=A0A1N7HUL9_9FLAO|nr:GNAT family N-acetyltransferase [Chryseobacterium shigense]PQA93196.1 GNAT family N-acetyltransferase [Chryseobacterium shigense]SIS28533.1 Protein N-acetyltransferase, RimJ/RimL family [Chryseobacterium shigense]